MNQEEAIQKARNYFLRNDNQYGCAETVFLILKEAYGLPDADDSTAAMALNGGVAYSGGICGALSGAALAVGLLAGQRFKNHKQAKRTARCLVAWTMDRFAAAQGAVNCRELTGLDLREEGQHQQFIQDGLWRGTCMQGIEFVVRELSGLSEEETWQRAVEVLSK